MIGKVFVNAKFVKDIDLPKELASSEYKLFPYFDRQKIKIKAQNSIGTTTGFVQVYLPDLDILIND